MTDGAWKLVPVEPSEAMVKALRCLSPDYARELYAGVLAVAPSPSPLTDAELLRMLHGTVEDSDDCHFKSGTAFFRVDCVLAFARAVERRLMEGK